MIPSKVADDQYSNSRIINEQLNMKVRHQQTIFEDVECDVRKAKANVKKNKDLRNDELLAEVKTELNSDEKIKAPLRHFSVGKMRTYENICTLVTSCSRSFSALRSF